MFAASCWISLFLDSYCEVINFRVESVHGAELGSSQEPTKYSLDRVLEAMMTIMFMDFSILLMAEILHQLIGSSFHCLQGFIHPRWCRISAINSMLGQN